MNQWSVNQPPPIIGVILRGDTPKCYESMAVNNNCRVILIPKKHLDTLNCKSLFNEETTYINQNEYNFVYNSNFQTAKNPHEQIENLDFQMWILFLWTYKFLASVNETASLGSSAAFRSRKRAPKCCSLPSGRGWRTDGWLVWWGRKETTLAGNLS